MSEALTGTHIAILATYGVEEAELTELRRAVIEAEDAGDRVPCTRARSRR